MKPKLALCATSLLCVTATHAQSILLGGFQGTNDTAIQSPAATGVTVTLTASTGDITPSGGSMQSNKTTWGTQALDVAPSDTASRQIVQSGTHPWSLTLTIANVSAAGDVVLDSIHYWTKKDVNNQGPPEATFAYTAGDLGAPNSTTLLIANGVTPTDFALGTGGFLSDLTLSVGESATFTWTSGAPQDPNGNTGLRIDNFAISGEVVNTGPDTTPPTPSPMTWASAPAAAGDSSITMTATTAADLNGVEYFFDETSGSPGGTDSGWQDSPTYTDDGLQPDTTYIYTVTARDKSAGQNETAPSTPTAPATTDPLDTAPPTPDPMTWASVPTAVNDSSVTMTATTAEDPSGVEYSFVETSGNPGGSDSGWQDSPEYTDTGLSPETRYIYTVTARDKSIGQYETAPSTAESVTTPAVPTGPVLLGGFDGNNAVDGSSPIQGTGAVGIVSVTLGTSDPLTSGGFNWAGGMQSSSILWGTTDLDPDASTANNNAVFAADNPVTVSIVVTNTSSTKDVTLQTLHWISKRDGSNSPITAAITYASGSLTDPLGTSDEYFLGGVGTIGHDYDLSNLLADRVLAPGETATINWSTPAGMNQRLRLDNIALSGTLSDSDYFAWSSEQGWTVGDPGTSGNDDFDRDGLTNDVERIFGLNPKSGSSINPLVTLLDPATGTFSYTRRSQSITGLNYPIWFSTDLKNWFRDINATETPGPPSNDIETVDVQINPVLLSGPRLFIQLRPEPPVTLPAPELINVSGSINTITLNFTEEMYQLTATDAGNYTVQIDGGDTVTVTGASLSENNKTVTLTLGSTLSLASTYTVGFGNLSGVTGVPLAGGTVGQFETWDDDPNGVKVFILAGQSNMVGYGHSELGAGGVAGGIGTLRYLAVNNASYPEYDYTSLLETPGDPANSAWQSRSEVKVWWRDGSNGNLGGTIRKSDLLPNQGAPNGVDDWFGPEYAFGQVLGDHYASDDVLIIKTAWGGRDLAEKFRPPSAVADRGGVVGEYYSAIFEYAREVLDNLGGEFPEWSDRGYQVVGFAWHQGYNDRVNSTFSVEYKDNLPDLINDVRAELGKPDLPFVISSTGMGGGAVESAPYSGYSEVEKAQLWVAGVPQPANVRSSDTRGFWEEAADSPRNQGFHWNQNARTYFRIGKALGDDMVDLLTP